MVYRFPHGARKNDASMRRGARKPDAVTMDAECRSSERLGAGLRLQREGEWANPFRIVGVPYSINSPRNWPPGYVALVSRVILSGPQAAVPRAHKFPMFIIEPAAVDFIC